jgi:hypothetical protein
MSMFFLVFYAGQFFLLSVVTALVFFAVPRLRPYTLHAFVVPLAFGASAIVGMLAILLLGDHVLHVAPQGWAVGIVIFIVPGLCGAAIAIYALNFLQSKLRKTLEAPAASRRIRPF